MLRRTFIASLVSAGFIPFMPKIKKSKDYKVIRTYSDDFICRLVPKKGTDACKIWIPTDEKLDYIDSPKFKRDIDNLRFYAGQYYKSEEFSIYCAIHNNRQVGTFAIKDSEFRKYRVS